MNRRLNPLAAALAAAFAIPAVCHLPAFGQASPNEATLPEVRVTAGADNQSYRAIRQGSSGFVEKSQLDTPFQVNVFTEQLMKDQVSRSLVDVTKNDPAVVPSNAMPGYYDGVNIRGFELNNWSGYRREGLMFANQASQPMENKERIEIVKGLSALRYGFTNPGGIVNWVLKKPTAKPLADLTVHANEFGGVGTHADLGGRFGNERQLGYRINLAAERERTHIKEVEGNRRMASGYFDWRLSRDLLAEFEIEHQERSLPQQVNVSFNSFAPGVARFLPTAAGATTFLGQTWGTYPTEMTNTSARLMWSLNNAWMLRTAVQYSDLWRDQQSAGIRAGSLQANGDFQVTTFYSPDQTRRALTTETALEGNFETGGIKHELAVGIATMDHKVRFGDSLTPVLGASNIFAPMAVPGPIGPGLPSTMRSRNRESALFAADYVTLNPQWSAFVGLRHTRPDYITFDNTQMQTAVYDKAANTPSAGVVFKPVPSVSLYASYAEGIEQGGTAPATVSNRNEVQPPLESKQLEIGIKSEVFAGATLSAAAFKIDKGLEYVNGANVYVQDGRQVHTGAELSLSGEIARGLRLVGGVMWLDPRVERTSNTAILGKRPVNAARRQASLYLDADVSAVPGLALSGGLFHSGAKAVDAANTLFVPGYTRFDLGARYATRIAGKATVLRAYLENVTDKTYFNSTSFGSMQFGSPRALRISASTSF
ncbi:TonB-dependent siderophore receptor [Noviherbaspirillum aerium]|uniref:TonB-dependent siderophore receptor n=1 Tax=Noviherbaspirillum aerium TaxID=2588497 RepID=UPI00124EA5FE|nr:TonB-dependent siderophore receptor [Noviherbaspirillum aerium]